MTITLFREGLRFMQLLKLGSALLVFGVGAVLFQNFIPAVKVQKQEVSVEPLQDALQEPKAPFKKARPPKLRE